MKGCSEGGEGRGAVGWRGWSVGALGRGWEMAVNFGHSCRKEVKDGDEVSKVLREKVSTMSDSRFGSLLGATSVRSTKSR